MVLFSGCATMTKEECLVANWEAIGEADGTRGKLPDYIGKRSSNCVKNGIYPDQEKWQKGRKKGLKNYCTSRNLYRVGLEGGKFSPVCGFVSFKNQKKLDNSFRRGKRIYTLNKSIKDAKKRIERYETDYNKLRSGDNLKYKTEREARNRMIELDRKLQHLRKEVVLNEHTLSQLRH